MGIGVQQSCSIHAHVHVHVHVHVLLRPSTHPLKPRVSPALPSRRTAIAASWPTRFTLTAASFSSACLRYAYAWHGMAWHVAAHRIASHCHCT